ncbi:hypothetical protein MJG53_000050 [Ovis ammon polii x Ovis aries]|nr:hypothetical protein MJG53_000050 [Ovis ammon polii x Ovis aries]
MRRERRELFPYERGKGSLISRCSRLTTVPSGTRSGGLRKGQTPCDFLGGLSGFLCCRCRFLRPCVESGPDLEDSSPVLTWIVGCDGNAGNSFPTKQGKDPSSRARRRKRVCLGCVRDPRASSQEERGPLDLRRGPQGPALVSSGKTSPHASSSGASRDSSPVDAGALDLVWSRDRNLRNPVQC